MSAKWRRDKKRSRWLNLFKNLSKNNDRKTSHTLWNEKSRFKRRTYPHRHGLPGAYRRKIWKDPEPLIDVLEEKEEILVVAELAGFRKENLKIQAEGQWLTLFAENMDRRFHRRLNLPKTVIPGAMHTTFKNGVVKIRLKKALGQESIGKVAD